MFIQMFYNFVLFENDHPHSNKNMVIKLQIVCNLRIRNQNSITVLPRIKRHVGISEGDHFYRNVGVNEIINFTLSRKNP